ncbi:MAG: hypothetical protein K2Q21_12085 [Chitinophagaceae bacterium]|nr:hypothetical protein [Chitinophagaceae bacterium]
MKNLSKFGLVDLSISESTEIIGGMNPGEGIMYYAGRIEYKIKSWLSRFQTPQFRDFTEAQGDFSR